MAGADGAAAGAEVEGAVQQIAVDRAGQGPAVGRCRGQGEQAHALEASAELGGGQLPLCGDDVTHVRAGRLGAAIEQSLQGVEFVRGLEHSPTMAWRSGSRSVLPRG